MPTSSNPFVGAAPDLPFLRPNGTGARLSQFLTSETLLLVFLRHLA